MALNIESSGRNNHDSALNMTCHESVFTALVLSDSLGSHCDGLLVCCYRCFQKPLLADEYRVDYVQVDEKKTQALQNTKMEWKDVRQSKA